MVNTAENASLVRTYCDSYGISLTSECIELMLRHVDLVIETNLKFNLTRIVDAHDALLRHVVDSLLFVPSVMMHGEVAEKSFVDIGTGAGFPGVPLALATGMEGLLIDSVGKKVSAVASFVEELGIGSRVTAQKIRVEELAVSERGRFDFVTARAVADLGVLVEYASPMLKQGGQLIVSKGQIDDAEIRRGVRTAELAGMRMVSRETYELPENTGHRELIGFAREGKCKVKLPRQVGMAKHKPLCER